MIFDRPQWKLILTQKDWEIPNVDNTLYVFGEGKDEVACRHVIPAKFFSLLDSITGGRFQEMLKEDDLLKAEFTLIQEEGRWYYGFGFGQYYYEFWYYTDSNKPVWLNPLVNGTLRL